MGFFNYHAIARSLIANQKLVGYYITAKHNHISPALVLLFDDPKHPIMPIRAHRFDEYLKILPKERQIYFE